MPLVINRWNKKKYFVAEVKDRDVTLQREDKTTFTIERKELFANYTNLTGNEELEKMFAEARKSC